MTGSAGRGCGSSQTELKHDVASSEGRIPHPFTAARTDLTVPVEVTTSTSNIFHTRVIEQALSHQDTQKGGKTMTKERTMRWIALIPFALLDIAMFTAWQ